MVLLGIFYLKEYRSDQALVNEGGCLPLKCCPRWSCPNAVHEGDAVSGARLFYSVRATKFGNVSTKDSPPRLTMSQVS